MQLLEPSWHDARRVAHACAAPLPSERVSLVDAHGRTTASPISARTPLPPWPISAMDGWAVAGEGPWTVVGEVLAGSVWTSALASGQAVLIATGSAMPAGSDGVLRSEDGLLDRDGGLRGRVREGRDIRAAGQEARVADELVAAGVPLTPARIGLAAAAGHDAVEVVRLPKVQLIILGDELLHQGPAAEGRVRDSLGPQLPGWLTGMGVELVGSVRVDDTLNELEQALAGAEGVDLIVTTGGTAAGPVDHVHAAIAATGGFLLVDHVACRPGHPMLLAGWPSGLRLVGLPGNPLAAVVALLTLGKPVIDGLLGRPLLPLPAVVLGGFVGARGAKTRLVPARLEGGRGVPVPYVGSGMLRGLADADGLVVVAAGEGEPGSPAEWLAFA